VADRLPRLDYRETRSCAGSKFLNGKITDTLRLQGGAENAGVENSGVKKNVARRKTQALYVKVFEKVSALVPQIAPSCAVADFHEASVSAFHHVCQDAGVVGCWFHYAQAVMKRCNKIGLKESYRRNVNVATIVHCLQSAESAVLPASDIPDSKMQFLLAVSHSMGAHMESFRQRDEDSSSSNNNSEEDAETEAPTATSESVSADAAAADDCCEVCLVAPREGYALVPCGHARFCETCALQVSVFGMSCVPYGYHHGDVHIFKHEITNPPLIDNVKPELKLI